VHDTIAVLHPGFKPIARCGSLFVVVAGDEFGKGCGADASLVGVGNIFIIIIIKIVQVSL